MPPEMVWFATPVTTDCVPLVKVMDAANVRDHAPMVRNKPLGEAYLNIILFGGG